MTTNGVPAPDYLIDLADEAVANGAIVDPADLLGWQKLGLLSGVPRLVDALTCCTVRRRVNCHNYPSADLQAYDCELLVSRLVGTLSPAERVILVDEILRRVRVAQNEIGRLL